MVQSGVVGYIPYDSQKSKTYSLSTQAAKTVTPTTSNQTAVASGVYTTGAVTVKGDTYLKAENIKENVTIFGVKGSYKGGASVPTTSVLVDTENTFSYGYGVDVYLTRFVNGQIVNTHQFVGPYEYVQFNDVVVGSLITLTTNGFWLEDYTNVVAEYVTTDYSTVYLYTVGTGAYFMFWE